MLVIALPPATLAKRLLLRLTQEHTRPTSVAIARIILGAAGIHTYLSGYMYRDYLWGPNGPWSLEQVRGDIAAQNGSGLLPTFSLYTVASTDWWFELVFHLGLAVAIAFTLRGGRLLTFAHWAFLWSLFTRNPLIQDGGNNITIIVLFFLIWTRTDVELTVGRSKPRPQGRLSALMHNWAIGLIVFQVMVLYTVSGLWKVAGEKWQAGTAIYYAGHVEAYHFLDFLDPIIDNPYSTTLLAWGTMALEVAYPLLVLDRRTRGAIVGLVVLMHVGIALKMGLFGFMLGMVGVNALILTEADWLGMKRMARAFLKRSLMKSPRSSDARTPAPIPGPVALADAANEEVV